MLYPEISPCLSPSPPPGLPWEGTCSEGAGVTIPTLVELSAHPNSSPDWGGLRQSGGSYSALGILLLEKGLGCGGEILEMS